jgi:hypothetical protein
VSDYDPTDLQSLERKQADSATQTRLSKDTEESDIKWLMGSRRGRRILWTLLDRCGTFGDPFSTNSMVMANRAGQQGVGRVYFAMIQALAPEQYPTMVREAKERNARNDDDGSHTSN